jgi:hypothetical protein
MRSRAARSAVSAEMAASTGRGQDAAMTTPMDDDLPEPRDIALEQATPEQVEELEQASDDEDD